MHCCIMIWVSSICFLPIFCRAMQFSSLPSIAERLKGCLRKFMENIKTERSFFLYYAGNYLHVADQQSKLSLSHLEKGLERLTTEERKWNFLPKNACQFLKDFLAEINVAFKKSDNILCALEVLNAGNLKACVCYFLLNFDFFTKW